MNWTCPGCFLWGQKEDFCSGCCEPRPGLGEESGGDLGDSVICMGSRPGSSSSSSSSLPPPAPDASQWACDACTLRNARHETCCTACRTPKPGAAPAARGQGIKQFFERAAAGAPGASAAVNMVSDEEIFVFDAADDAGAGAGAGNGAALVGTKRRFEDRATGGGDSADGARGRSKGRTPAFWGAASIEDESSSTVARGAGARGAGGGYDGDSAHDTNEYGAGELPGRVPWWKQNVHNTIPYSAKLRIAILYKNGGPDPSRRVEPVRSIFDRIKPATLAAEWNLRHIVDVDDVDVDGDDAKLLAPKTIRIKDAFGNEQLFTFNPPVHAPPTESTSSSSSVDSGFAPPAHSIDCEAPIQMLKRFADDPVVDRGDPGGGGGGNVIKRALARRRADRGNYIFRPDEFYVQHAMQSQMAKLLLAQELAREKGIHFGAAAVLAGVAKGTITVVKSDEFYKRLQELESLGLRFVFQGVEVNSAPSEPVLPTKAAIFLEEFLTRARVSFARHIFVFSLQNLAKQNDSARTTICSTVVMTAVMVPSSSSSSTVIPLPGFKCAVPAYVKPVEQVVVEWPVDVCKLLYSGPQNCSVATPEGTNAYDRFCKLAGALGFKTSDENAVPPRGSIIYGGHGTTPRGGQIPFFTTTNWMMVKKRLIAAGKVVDNDFRWKSTVERFSTNQKGWSTHKVMGATGEYETGCLAVYTCKV